MAKLTADQKRVHEAIEDGNIAKLKDIFKKLVNGKDAEGRTPLQKTVNEEILIHLIKNGANVTCRIQMVSVLFCMQPAMAKLKL